MSIDKKATQVGNKFILESKQASFEELVAESINKIERELNLPPTNFSDALKNRRN